MHRSRATSPRATVVMLWLALAFGLLAQAQSVTAGTAARANEDLVMRFAFVSAVPEPSTIVLAGTGQLVMGAGRTSRRRRPFQAD